MQLSVKDDLVWLMGLGIDEIQTCRDQGSAGSAMSFHFSGYRFDWFSLPGRSAVLHIMDIHPELLGGFETSWS